MDYRKSSPKNHTTEAGRDKTKEIMKSVIWIKQADNNAAFKYQP